MNDHSIFVWAAMVLALVALGITVYLFRHRWFDKGYKKGEAASPSTVRAQNPPDGGVHRDRPQMKAR